MKITITEVLELIQQERQVFHLVEGISHHVEVGRNRRQELGAGKGEALLKLCHITENLQKKKSMLH